ncbi:MAG: hypothetical protein ABI120_00535 [Gemmatimonadaceae bacterium]
MFPNEYDPEDDDSSEQHADDARPAVFVTTREAVPLVVSQLDDPRAPESSALASYINNRMVARSAMPAEAIQRLLDLKLFETPVSLGLFAYEESPGLQCRLFALVPRGALESEAHSAEPWKESVPSYEAARDAASESDDEFEMGDEEDEPTPFETILLGHIVRFERDRKHPGDLAAEAVDILQRIINGAPLEDADRKAIDDLLGSL